MDMSSDNSASPPSASNSCDCVVFLLPSFMPLPLNCGARAVAGAGDAVRTGAGVGSKRVGTGEYPDAPPPIPR